MARKITGRSFPEMGIQEPEISFDDVYRALNHILSDSFLESPAQSPVSTSLVERSSLEDRKNYYVQVASRISESKRNFLTMYHNISSIIESTTEQIVAAARIRERELKAELWAAGETKRIKWNQQLSMCSKAVRYLENWDRGHGRTLPETFPTYEHSEPLDFVDAGEIRFDPGNTDGIIQPLQRWGKLSLQKEGDVGFGPSFVPKFVIGQVGSEPGQFCRPWGVCTDATGRILVCDRSNNRIQVFNECGEFIFQFGKQGSRPGEFYRPTGIDVDARQRIVVADKDNHRIQVFSYSGQFLIEFGCKGSDLGQFLYPWDVATNKQCNIAVSDSKNFRIQLFDSRGHLLNHFDAKKMGIGNPRLRLQFFENPRGVCFRPDGKLLATDFNNHRVIIIDQSFARGEYFCREGSNLGEFKRPQGIACDKAGNFAVADCKNHRIQVFDHGGNLIKCFGRRGKNPGEFDCPQGISFHPNGSIIVVDFENNRVQVF